MSNASTIDELGIEVEDAFLTVCEQTDAGATVLEVHMLLRDRGIFLHLPEVTDYLNALETEPSIPGAGFVRGGFSARFPEGHPKGYLSILGHYADMDRYKEMKQKLNENDKRERWLQSPRRGKIRSQIRFG